MTLVDVLVLLLIVFVAIMIFSIGLICWIAYVILKEAVNELKKVNRNWD